MGSASGAAPAMTTVRAAAGGEARTWACFGASWRPTRRASAALIMGSWMATRTSKSTLEVLLRIAWRTVGAIVTRVVAEGVAARDPLEGLSRIGIDEISYKKGHRYITIVVEHDTGRLVWAAPAGTRHTVRRVSPCGTSACARGG